MRAIWCLAVLLGCDTTPSDATTTAASAAAPAAEAPSADGPSAAGAAPGGPEGAGPSARRGKRGKSGPPAARSNGDVVHSVRDGLSKADRDSGLVARCSDGSLVFGFWQGEYPSPVVQLDRPLRTKVRTDPCGGTTVKGCTAPAGLYHPWAKDTQRPEGTSFGVRTMPEAYTLAKPHSVAGQKLAQGTTVTVLTYLSEGLCSMEANGQRLEDMCPGTGPHDDTIWKRTGGEQPEPVQMVQVRCTGGSTGWLVVDDALMGTAGVREGLLQGYGEVAPAP